MTGGNRLLAGLAWPAIFFIFYRRHRVKEMPVLRSNAMGILFWGGQRTLSIPLQGHLSITGVMFGLFGAYMYLASRFRRSWSGVRGSGPGAGVAGEDSETGGDRVDFRVCGGGYLRGGKPLRKG
jgi:hypothetical protein